DSAIGTPTSRVLRLADCLRLVEAVLLEVVDSQRAARTAAVNLVDRHTAVALILATAVKSGKDLRRWPTMHLTRVDRSGKQRQYDAPGQPAKVLHSMQHVYTPFLLRRDVAHIPGVGKTPFAQALTRGQSPMS